MSVVRMLVTKSIFSIFLAKKVYFEECFFFNQNYFFGKCWQQKFILKNAGNQKCILKNVGNQKYILKDGGNQTFRFKITSIVYFVYTMDVNMNQQPNNLVNKILQNILLITSILQNIFFLFCSPNEKKHIGLERNEGE